MPADCCKSTWSKVPEDEPTFILRAKDLLAPAVLQDWIESAQHSGVNPDKITHAQEHLEAFEAFQRLHPERCKLPD